MKTIMVMAQSFNRIIGDKGTIPWKCPEDMKFFKELTTGHCVIMGRKTFESIGNKPLKNRLNFVVSSELECDDPNVVVCRTIEQARLRALEYCVTKGCHVFVIGGAQIYQHFLDEGLIDEIYLSVIKVTVDGDTFAPIISNRQFAFDQQVEEKPSFRVLKFKKAS